MNEPKETATAGYGQGTSAPGFSDGIGTRTYVVAHNQIRAHAYAYRVYEEEFKQEQQGNCVSSYFLHFYLNISLKVKLE